MSTKREINRKVVIVTYDELEDRRKGSQLLANWDLTLTKLSKKLQMWAIIA